MDDGPNGSRESASRGTAGTAGTRASSPTAQRTRSRWRGGQPLVELPFMPPVDPAEAVKASPRVPETRRFCSGCGAEVGRGVEERSGREKGFCSKCRTPFSFVPALQPQDLLAGQYRVLGCLAYGGLGWIYLAQDERVANRWVVLKGVLDAGDKAAVAAALAERQFLARVEHPNVVRIYNVVEGAGGGFIVMEYVGGMTLKGVLRERQQEALGPLPVDLAIAYILAVLPAFGYLHDLGLVYNDFKPDNVMLHGSDVKLIDLGAVTRLGDPDPVVYGTEGFEAPEKALQGPSIAADLYSIARCLAVLVLDLQTYQSTHRFRLPGPASEPLFRRHESLYRFLVKATAHDPRDRYQRADEMAEALEAILREVAATTQGTPRPAPSKLFGGDVLALRWAASEGDPAPDWRHLPPLRVDPTDAAASYLLDAAALEPTRELAVLREAMRQGAIEATVEARFAVARALIEVGLHDVAEEDLAQLDSLDRGEWRGNWYRGLSLLAQQRAVDAGLAFDLVRAELPGELAPRLALGLAAELAGDLREAERHYDVVSATDPSLTVASFGLARARQAMGDAAGAVEAYDRIPATSSLAAQAQLAQARVLMRSAPSGPDGPPPPASGGGKGPTVDALARASSLIERLQLGDQQRAELAVQLLEAGLGLLGANGPGPPPDVELLGHPLRELPMRFALERAYRDLAWVAVGDEKIRLVDRANDVRPMTDT